MALSTSVEEATGRVPITIVSLDGELDASNFEHFADEFRPLYDAGTRNLLLDLTDLTFLASSGLVALSSIVRILHGKPPIDPETGWGALHELGHDVADGDDADAGPAGRSAAGRRARPAANGPRPAVPHPPRSGDRRSKRSERAGGAGDASNRLAPSPSAEAIVEPFDGTGADGGRVDLVASRTWKDACIAAAGATPGPGHRDRGASPADRGRRQDRRPRRRSGRRPTGRCSRRSWPRRGRCWGAR